MWPGEDPLAVRVGGSMFALRRREAQAIRARRGSVAARTGHGCALSATMDAGVIAARDLRVALVGVPNCGKTALFNRLTGSRQKVANYPGVTVERKEGAFVGPSRRVTPSSTCRAPTA